MFSGFARFSFVSTVSRHVVVCLQGLLAKAAFHDKLDMNAIAAAVSQGLGDDKVIKPTAHALICCLCQLSPTSVLTHLKDSMITPLNKTLSQRLKDDAIPQEVCMFNPLCLCTLSLFTRASVFTLGVNHSLMATLNLWALVFTSS